MNAFHHGLGGAALQQNGNTILMPARRLLWTEQPPWPTPDTRPHTMTAPKPREIVIKGVTLDGGTFRPSDWSERLAGAMSCFRPEGSASGIAAFIGYSPYCVPRTIDGVKCVIVSEALRDIELMAWDFVTNFARDNRLQVVDVPSVPADAGPP
jgi:Protein of unknown function (DUF3579)